MRRQGSSKIEFLRMLRDLSGLETATEFASACGRSDAQLSGYLSGNSVPGPKVLRDCARRLFNWEVETLVEIAPLEGMRLPDTPGVYVLFDSSLRVLYVGQAKRFSTEVAQARNKFVTHALRSGEGLAKVSPRLGELARYVSLYEIHDSRVRHNIEALLIRVCINQTHNTNIGNFI